MGAAVAAPAAVGSAKAIVTWDPKRAMAYECMSFLPDMTDKQIAAQVDYMISNGWTPCVEFEFQSPAGPAKGPGRERARTAPPPSAVTMSKVEMGQPVTSHPRPARLRLPKEFSTQYMYLVCRKKKK